MIRKLLGRLGFPLAAITAVLAPVLLFAGPAQATGVYHNQWESNGNYAMGGDGFSGTPVNEVGHPGRNYVFVVVGVDQNNDDYGYLKAQNSGAIVSADNNCQKVTMKSSESSNGTVIELDPANPNHYWRFRYCGYAAITGLGTGDQLVIRGVGGGGFQRWSTVN